MKRNVIMTASILLWVTLFLVMLVATRYYNQYTYMLENVYDFSTDWKAVSADKIVRESVALSHNNQMGSSRAFTFVKKLPLQEEQHADIMLTVYQQSIEMYVGDQQIVRYPRPALCGKEMYLFKEWVRAELPEGYGGKILTLTVRDSVTPGTICIDRLWLGNLEALEENRMRVDFFSEFVGMMLMLLGICNGVLSFGSGRRWNAAMRSQRLLSLLACCIGVWYYATHRSFSYLFVNPVLRGFSMMLLSYFSCWLICMLLDTVCVGPLSTVIRITGRASLILAAVFTAFGLLELPNFGYWSHGFITLLLFTVALIAATLIRNWRKEKATRTFLWMLLVTTASIAADRLQDGTLPRIISGLEYSNLCILIGFAATAVHLQRRQYAFQRESAEKQIVEMRLQMQSEHYHALYQTMDDLRVIAHDMRFHLLAMQSMLQRGRYTETVDYIQTLIQKGNLNGPAILNTRNPILDAILSEAQTRAVKQGTVLQLEVSLPAECRVRAQDWCAIMGNALDNALKTAAGKAGGVTKVKLMQDEGVIYGVIQNTAPQRRKITPDIGMHSMQEALHRYGGDMEYALADGWFTLRFFLPLESSPGPNDSSTSSV